MPNFFNCFSINQETDFTVISVRLRHIDHLAIYYEFYGLSYADGVASICLVRCNEIALQSRQKGVMAMREYSYRYIPTHRS